MKTSPLPHPLLLLLIASLSTVTTAKTRWFGKLRAGAADLRSTRPSFFSNSHNKWGTTSFSASLFSNTPDAANDDDEAGKMIIPQSDLRRPGRRFHIVTTAALPWFTGTAVNPLLRAAYLHRHTAKSNSSSSSLVTLVVPWLEQSSDQERLYGRVFRTMQEQETYIREWLFKEAGMPDAAAKLHIRWYPARYHAGLGSIFAMGDILACCEDDILDVCILEEPEHCNWYRAPSDSWTQRFEYVVGVVHTNYKEYAASHYTGLWTAPAIAWLSSFMVRAYCHKVVKLSDTLQDFAPEKEVTCNVHGVRSNFCTTSPPTRNSIYFVGKLLWPKGLDLLLELQEYYKDYTGDYFPIDIYGSGPDQEAIERAYYGRKHTSIHSNSTTMTSSFPRTFSELRRQPIPACFRGRVDHGELVDAKIFVNPSISEVLCTTTAEALAMGKFAIVPYHPSNRFFLQFPNCLQYRDKFEFVANLRWALTHQPTPLTKEQRRQFTWEAATERLLDASATQQREAALQERWRKFDQRIAKLHKSVGQGSAGDFLRKLLGAGPVSAQVQYQNEQQQHRQVA